MSPNPLSALWREPRIVIARRELASLRSEKTIVLALAIQLFIAAFSSFLIVGLVSLYSPTAIAGVTVDAGITGSASDDLAAVIDDQDGIDALTYAADSDARDAFQSGRIDVLFIASHQSDGRITVDTLVPNGGLRTTLTVVTVRETLEAFERAERQDRVERLTTEPVPLPAQVPSSPYFGFTYTILIPVLVFLPVFISGSIIVDSVTEELERGTLELLRVAPVTIADVVDGKLFAAIALAPAQATLWLGLLAFNDTAIVHPSWVILVTTALTTIVVTMGAAIAIRSSTRRDAQFLYSVGVLAFFAGAAVFPEHPANTVARLAVGSADAVTYGSVVGYLVIGVVAYAVTRRYVAARGAKA